MPEFEYKYLPILLEYIKKQYPTEEKYISFFHVKTTKSFLMYRGKKIYNFNPEILEHDLQFFMDNPLYLKSVAEDLFIKRLHRYYKFWLKRLGKMPPNERKPIDVDLIKSLAISEVSNTKAAIKAETNYKNWKYQSIRVFIEVDGKQISAYEHLLNKSRPNRFKKKMKLSEMTSIERAEYEAEKFRITKKRLYRHRFFKRIHLDCIIPEKCSVCGFEEKRASDFKTPLLWNYINGNEDDLRLDNIQYVCFNCYFLYVPDYRKRLAYQIQLEAARSTKKIMDAAKSETELPKKPIQDPDELFESFNDTED